MLIDELFKLLQQRFKLPKDIPEDEKFKRQLDKGQVCFGEFNRSYNNKYVQPIRRRVLKVLLQWVKDDPWKEMEISSGGGLMLCDRIQGWTERVDTEINDQSNTSPSVKSAMRQLRTELERHGKDLRPYGDNNGGMLERKRD